MELSSTSTQRTYRHLRLAIVACAVMVLVALVVVTVAVGPVTSLSALYYTPGRTLFTGAMFGIALALVALSGHSVEQVLLDIAAVFAAFIAVVPTPLGAHDAPGAGGRCPEGTVCLPATDARGAAVGVIAVAVMGILVSVAAVCLAAARRGAGQALSAGVLGPVVVVVLVSVGALLWLGVAAPTLLAFGHLVATAAFFCIMIAVSLISSITAHRPWRALYLVVTVGMGVSLVYLTVVFVAHLSGAGLGQPWVLVGEVALIVFFMAFWLGQTAQKWQELDPAIMTASRHT
jgi:hypothetical protein